MLEWGGPQLHLLKQWEGDFSGISRLFLPGTYTVSVTTTKGCVLYTATYTLDDDQINPLEVTVSETVTPSSCAASDGQIVLSLTGGYPPYSVLWERKTSTNSWTHLSEYDDHLQLNNLYSGTYRYTVKDATLTTTTTLCPVGEVMGRINWLDDQQFNDFVSPLDRGFEYEVQSIDCNTGGLASIQLMANPSVLASETLYLDWGSAHFGWSTTWEESQGVLDNIREEGTYVVSITNAAGCLVKTMDIVVEQFPKSTLAVAITNVVTQVSVRMKAGQFNYKFLAVIPLMLFNGRPLMHKGNGRQFLASRTTRLPE